jgi:hypothetical protein
MPAGFAFQPDLFAEYQKQVKAVVGDYQTIAGQLEQARITGEEKTNRLLGAPEALGPSGPPVDFTNQAAQFQKLLGDHTSGGS